MAPLTRATVTPPATTAMPRGERSNAVSHALQDSPDGLVMDPSTTRPSFAMPPRPDRTESGQRTPPRVMPATP